MKNDINDQIINLNGDIAARKRDEARLEEARGKEETDLSPDENETLDELKARLAKRAKKKAGEDQFTKSLRSLEAITAKATGKHHRSARILAKALNNEPRRLVLLGSLKSLLKAMPKATPEVPAVAEISPINQRNQHVDNAYFDRAVRAFSAGAITGTQLNVVDVCRRNNYPIDDLDLIAAINSVA